MKKIFFLLLIFLLTDAFFSQSKYFIYFKDKSGEKLEKKSQQYYEVMNTLSPRSIERRKKHLGEDIISIEDLPVNHNYIQVLEAKGCKIIHELKWLNAVSCYLTDLQKREIVNLNFVKSVESVRKLSVPKFEISDEGFNRLNKIHNTNFDYGPSSAQIQLSDVQLLHNEGINGEGVIIGFLDAGFSYKTHPAFTQLTVLDEYDFVYSDDDVSNDGDASHGTAVLSLAAGFDEGELISPAFKSNYLLAKTEDIRTEKNIEEDNYAAGLEWMEAKGADIVSSSLGYSEFDSLQHSYTYKDMDGKTTVVARASNLAFQKGLVTVTSAGNEGNWPWRYITSPGDAINVITVGAVNSSNQIAS
ncbi:MAG: S8 family serine peptidase, partial [Bacteroidetes bacterium]|nr:S8 family serine peptidase [Bacteroidota bacterium]